MPLFPGYPIQTTPSRRSLLENPDLLREFYLRRFGPGPGGPPPPILAEPSPAPLPEEAPPVDNFAGLRRAMATADPRGFPQAEPQSFLPADTGEEPEAEPASPEDSRRSRLQKLEALRDAAQGMNTVGQGIRDAAIAGTWTKHGLNVPPPQPFRTQGLDQAIADELDRVPKGMADTLRGQGYAIPDESRFSDLKTLFPALEAVERRRFEAKENAADRASREKVAANNLEAAKNRQEGVQDRFDTAQGNIAGRAETNQMLGVQRQYNSIIKPLRDAKFAAQKALASLGTDTSTGDLAALVQAARASGDTRLSDFDIKRWTRRPGIKGLEDWASWMATSRMTPEHLDEANSVIKAFIDSSNEAMAEQADAMAGQYSPTLKMDKEELRARFLPEAGAAPQGGAAGERLIFIPGEGEGEAYATPEQIKALQDAGIQFELR